MYRTTTSDTFDIHPKLRQDAVFLQRGQDTLLRTPARSARLDGTEAFRLLSRLSPHLDGRRSLGEICSGLGGARRAAVGALVRGLLEHGFVIDARAAGSDRFPAQLEYLDHVATDADRRFARFRAARILAVGDGHSLHAAAVGLFRNGASSVRVAPTDDEWPHWPAVRDEAEWSGAGARAEISPVPTSAAGYDLVLYCADRAEPARTAELVASCLGSGTPFVPMVTTAGWGLLGPLVRPAEDGCWWCAWVGLVRSASAEGIDSDDAILTPTVAAMLGGAAAFEAFRLLTGALPMDTDDSAVVQELRTLESVRLRMTAVTDCDDAHTSGPGLSTIRSQLTRLRRWPSEPATIRTFGAAPPSQPATHPSGPIQIVRDYVEATGRLGRERFESTDFAPDWADRPSTFKTYPLARMLALPHHEPAELSLVDALGTARAGDYTLDSLAWLLRMSYGVLARRLRVDWNLVNIERTRYPDAFWSRGSASGGGLYPAEIYWVTCGDEVPAGIYHYAPGHHALEQLTEGDMTARVRAALQQNAYAERTDQYLLVSLRFWRSAFKYANLGYHVGTLDVGALLGSLDLLSAGIGVQLRRFSWFDDSALNELLDLDTDDESVIAAVSLPWRPARRSAVPADSRRGPAPSAYQRSRTIVRFPRAERVHRSALVAHERRPDPNSGRSARILPAGGTPHLGDLVELPSPETERLSEPVSALLAKRQSSSGGFVAAPDLPLEQLGTVLDVAVRARGYLDDLAPDPVRPTWTRLSVLANHVRGLPRGCYQYVHSGHTLRRAPGVDVAADWPGFLQRVGASLTNYSLEQAAAVLVISGRWEAMLSAYGARGYRVLGGEAGTVAQVTYLAAAGLGLGCGAVLNLDHIEIDAGLGFAGTDERTIICLLVGGDRRVRAAMDFRLD